MRAIIALALALGTAGTLGAQRTPGTAGTARNLGNPGNLGNPANLVRQRARHLTWRGRRRFRRSAKPRAGDRHAGRRARGPDGRPRQSGAQRRSSTVGRRVRRECERGHQAHPAECRHRQPAASVVSLVRRNLRQKPWRTAGLPRRRLARAARAAAGVTPATLPEPGALDRITPADRFLGVGYGYAEIIPENNAGTPSPSDGKRRRWRTGVKILNEAWIRLEDDPAKGYGQLCRGDSGAPIFMERRGREVLVGVVSHSDGQGCGPGTPTIRRAGRQPGGVELDPRRNGKRAD